MKKNKIISNIPYFIMFVVLSVYFLVIVAVLIFGLLNSFRSVDDDFLINGSLFGFPNPFVFSNYLDVADKIVVQSTRYIYLPEMILNTIIYSFGGSAILTFTCLVMAYCTSKFNFKFNIVINSIYFFTMLFPIVGSMASTINLLDSLGLFDTWTGMFLMRLNFTSTGFLILQGFLRSVDNGYIEAARIDGASEFAIFFRIIIPMLKNVIFVLFLGSFMGYWNDYQTSLVYMPSHPTALTGLHAYATDPSNGAYIPTQFAGYMIMAVPVFALFFIFKKKILTGLSEGGLKG